MTNHGESCDIADHSGDIKNGQSGLFGDLQDPRLMYLKAFLFAIIGLLCIAGIFITSPTLQTALLLALGIWSFCRLYYFAFYVIEKYIDPTYRFAGLSSLLIYFISRWRGRGRSMDG